jgi:peptide methionine sulfoxide reductase MsrA
VIFAEDTEQLDAAQRVLDANRDRVRGEIVTEITPAKPFWRAEEYHQCYLDKRQTAGGMLRQLLGR